MSVTAPLEVELQQGSDLQILDDDIMVVPDLASADAGSSTTTVELGRDPLIPFLILGVVSLIAVLAISMLLVF